MKPIYPVATLLFCALALFSCSSGGGGSDDDKGSSSDNSSEDASEDPTPSSTATPTPTATPVDSSDQVSGHVWTVSEILLEPETGGAGGTPLCGGEFGFKRCTCAPDVPSYVRYRPAVVECNGNAAAILSGPLLDAFSVVVRDTQNRDRWPAAGSGFGGCSASLADSDSPPNRCSAFKVQSKFPAGGGTAVVYCFGASGYDPLFSDAARLTVKITNDPTGNDDQLERYCLFGPTVPLN